MLLRIISLLLVLIGISCLAGSLVPTRKICTMKHEQTRGWKILGVLIIFFIIGYLTFGFLLLQNSVETLELVVSIILGGGGVFVSMVTNMAMRTIRNIEKITAREHRRTLYDELTDLPNRTLLYEKIYYGIRDAERQSDSVAVLVLDIDRFKEFNDALGHYYGDHLLQLIAARILKAVRKTDTVSRLGGDEFAIALPGVDAEQAILVAEKICKYMEEPFIIQDQSLNVEVSIGIALYPEHGNNNETLLQRASVAMYASKKGGSKYTIYAAKHDKFTINRLKLTEDLRAAINKDQLFLLYQPIINIMENKIYGAEALVRWHHPDQKEPVSPDDFISLAEQTGQIEQLTYWVIDNALKQMSLWIQQGVFIPTSVNLSAKSLYNIDFPKSVTDLLEKWQVPSHMLTFEITESSLISNQEKARKVITALHKEGVSFSIDDFGTGFFPFASLKHFPIKNVKIDKSFVQGMLDDEFDAAIVRTTTDLANSMGFKPIAEGIENQKIIDMLKQFGCFLLQGYFLCPPLPAKDLLIQLKEKNYSRKN
jgi:diguanylate cyclase (GGDEF)-like protein